MDPTLQQGGGMPFGMPSGMPEGSQPVTEEQKQVLVDMISEIRSRMDDLKALQFASSNKTDTLRRSLLKQVFEKLQMAGVDLTDRSSVTDFLSNLRQESPELADMFEKSMDVLLGGEGVAPPIDEGGISQGVPPQDNMNNINPDETIPPNMG